MDWMGFIFDESFLFTWIEERDNMVGGGWFV
jgi:hypothetical protein